MIYINNEYANLKIFNVLDECLIHNEKAIIDIILDYKGEIEKVECNEINSIAKLFAILYVGDDTNQMWSDSHTIGKDLSLYQYIPKHEIDDYIELLEDNIVMDLDVDDIEYNDVVYVNDNIITKKTHEFVKSIVQIFCKKNNITILYDRWNRCIEINDTRRFHDSMDETISYFEH